MNKARIEALSDGVFSIVMTLLVIDIKVPQLVSSNSIHELWGGLTLLWPVFRSYFISFAILGMYWITHHALFHMFVKHANRPLTYINILFLAFIALVPFSASLVAQYPHNELAVSIYGANIIVIGSVQYLMFHWAVTDQSVRHEDIETKTVRQASVRLLLPPAFAVLGIIASLFHSALSFFLFAFPVVFNIIPGTPQALENLRTKLWSKP